MSLKLFTKVRSSLLRGYSKKLLSTAVNDDRPKRQNRIIKNLDGLKVTYEMSVPEDFDEILKFYVKYFRQSEAIAATLKMSAEECEELFSTLLIGTENLVVSLGDTIVGMQTLKKYTLNESPTGNPEFLADYGKLVDAGPFKHRTNNIIHTFLEAVEKPLLQAFDTPCIYYHSICGGLNPKYHKSPIAVTGVRMSISHAFKNGAKYFYGVGTSEKSMNMQHKLPGTAVFKKFAYADYNVHGQKPLEHVVGDNKYAHVFMIDLDKYRKEYE